MLDKCVFNNRGVEIEIESNISITDILGDDLRLVPVFSSLYGVRRLQIKEIIRLQCQEEFILFIPPTSKDDPPEVKSSRDGLLRQMLRIVLAPHVTSSTPQQRDLAWNKHLKKHKVNREGTIMRGMSST